MVAEAQTKVVPSRIEDRKVKRRISNDAADDDDSEYKMPDAYDDQGRVNQEKRFAVAMQRYRNGGESGGKMYPFAEQEAWEQHQIGKATLKFGSKDKKHSAADYDYVFEDQIDFVRQSVIEGDNFEVRFQANHCKNPKQSLLWRSSRSGA
ncbi:pre-mRNA-splicing factor ATP-dependent RNA helicase DEAH1-like isoform X2 [Silene latifolia]|uniref:pre-mRNA-splicing factor ATP-dependent RNA helicase DEAH1-like isoform X2 n=1 Tax=Silene latifolia TaxID=37657 RepID=UPI003D789273